MAVLATLTEYLSHSLVRNALIVGVLIALCASLLGTTIVLKRLSFIGDGLSHVAFGALAIAMVLSLSDKMFVVLPIKVKYLGVLYAILMAGQCLQGGIWVAIPIVASLFNFIVFFFTGRNRIRISREQQKQRAQFRAKALRPSTARKIYI